MIVLFDGKSVRPEEATVSVLSPAFQHGFGVFETMRSYPQKGVFELSAHLNRLAGSAEAIGLPLPHREEELEEMVNQACELSLTEQGGSSKGETCLLKLMAIPDHTIVTARPLLVEQSLYNGVACKSVFLQRAIPKVKSLAFLESRLARAEAEKAGYHEAILVDPTTQVYEGAYSNLFWFEGETLCTREDKVLAGVTRGVVTRLFQGRFRYGRIDLESLKGVEEVFLTQTSTGILPIISIDQSTIGTGKPGAKTLELMARFREYTEG